MVSALPVQDHVDDGTFLANDDLIECCAQDPLACRGCRGRMRPGELEIGTELHQLLTLSLAQRRWLPRHDCGDLAFNAMHSLQCLVPAPLKLTGHQTIGGIDGIVLSTGMGGARTVPAAAPARTVFARLM